MLKRPMCSMPVVVIFVLGQDTSQLRQIPDKSPIQDLPAAGAVVGLDYSIAPGQAWGLRSSLSDLLEHLVPLDKAPVGDLQVFRLPGGVRVLVDQAAHDGFSAALLAIVVRHRGTGSVKFVAGDACAIPWCGRVAL